MLLIVKNAHLILKNNHLIEKCALCRNTYNKSEGKTMLGEFYLKKSREKLKTLQPRNRKLNE